MNMPIKIATLNLCLGLPGKKETVKQIIIKEKIDILCLQETEIANIDASLLSFKGYTFENENNSAKARVGMYINSNIKYVRRVDLEGVDSHLVIVDVCNYNSNKNLRLITIYRTFNPQNQQNPRQFF